jgi:hypothetical protein
MLAAIIAAVDWSSLTRTPEKVAYYRDEVYFREGLSDLRELAGASFDEVLRRSALMIVRPEGLVAGKLIPVHDFLVENRFQVVAAEPLRFDRMLARELWRYQHTLASLDRLAVTDQMLLAGPALLLLLRGAGSGLPETVRLSSLKGASDPAGRPPGTLRERLHQPNRLFALVHCADEPADLVRELGMLLDAPRRRGAIRALVAGALPAGHRAVLAEALDRDAGGGRRLDPAESLARVRRQLANAGPAAGRALALLDRMAAGEPVSWREFSRELDRQPARLDTWDVALVGSSFIEYDELGRQKLLRGPDLAAWRSSPAVF